MQILKKIKISNNNYYIIVDLEYKNKNSFRRLCLRNNKDDYWDEGDCSRLIEEVEKNYTQKKAAKDITKKDYTDEGVINYLKEHVVQTEE